MASSFTIPPTGTPTAVYTLTVLGDDVPRSFAADISVRHMPGGNVSYVDVGGATLRVLDLLLLFVLSSDALAFEAAVGQVGSLVVFDGTFTALLSSLRRNSRAVSTNGTTEVQAEFYIL